MPLGAVRRQREDERKFCKEIVLSSVLTVKFVFNEEAPMWNHGDVDMAELEQSPARQAWNDTEDKEAAKAAEE